MENKKIDISSLDVAELAQLFADLSEKSRVKIEKFRAKQVFSWLNKGVSSFDEMTNVSKAQREVLENNCYIALPAVEKKLVSQIDGTVKYLFRLFDGECIESVFMRYEHGNTICISTQAGCRMGCRFCASTIAGFTRNLTPSEMLGQVVAAQKDTGERISNIVMMGIGEPLDNFDNVKKFLSLVNSEDGLNIGYRHISLSTCGVVPKIYELSELKLPITLSISLHATSQEERANLMPIAKKYDINELLRACRKYLEGGGKRISFEYTMIEGENDSKEDALRLSKLLSGMLCHINLIPLNTVSGRDYRKSGKDAIRNFAAILEKQGFTATVRRRLGSDIDASCGQLRASKIEENNTKISINT